MSEPDYKMETLQTAGERAGETIPRAVADRLLRCLSFFATTIKAGERWSETCEREYDQALAEHRKAVSDGR